LRLPACAVLRCRSPGLAGLAEISQRLEAVETPGRARRGRTVVGTGFALRAARPRSLRGQLLPVRLLVQGLQHQQAHAVDGARAQALPPGGAQGSDLVRAGGRRPGTCLCGCRCRAGCRNPGTGGPGRYACNRWLAPAWMASCVGTTVPTARTKRRNSAIASVSGAA
jgi:hypothetical protein